MGRGGRCGAAGFMRTAPHVMQRYVITGSDLTDARASFDAGRLDAAADACRAALAREVGDPAALHLLGVILLRQGSAAEAVPLLESVADQRADAAVLNDLGEALVAAGLPDEAEQRFRAALSLDPNSVVANCNIACWLQDRGRHADAIPALRRALAVRPDLADAWLALGNAHLQCDEVAEAEHSFRSALAARPGFAEALNNLGNALVAQHRLHEASLCYTTALALRPDAAGTVFAHALALLLSGDFASGWPAFEARRRYDAMRWNYDRRPELPQWQPGMSLQSRRVLLMAEQ